MPQQILPQFNMPNIVGAFQQGQDRGRMLQANQLAGQAYGATGADRQQALSQLAGLDPRLAVGLGNSLTSHDQQQAKFQQAQQVDHAKKINGAANFMLQAYQSGDPAKIQGAYQSVRPYLAELGAAEGKVPPEQFDPAMLPHLYQIVGQSGGEAQQKGTVVAPGGALVDSATGKTMFSNPAKPANAQLVNVGDGKGGTVQMLLDPSTGKLSRPDFGGGQGGMGQPMSLDAINAKASELVNSGQMTPQQGDAWIKQQYQAAGMIMDGGMGGGLGYNPPKNTATRTLTPDEAKQYGLPDGTVAQMDATGKINIVSKPPQLSVAQEILQAQKAEKAAAAKADAVEQYDQSISQIDKLLNSPGASMLGTYSGDVAGFFPHTDTSNANAALDNIKNQVLLNTISKLKALSATGASGFGSLSNQEGEILKNSIASLDKKQTNAQLMDNLRNIKAMLKKSRDHISNAQIQFQGPQGGNGQQPQMPNQGGTSGGWSAKVIP